MNYFVSYQLLSRNLVQSYTNMVYVSDSEIKSIEDVRNLERGIGESLRESVFPESITIISINKL